MEPTAATIRQCLGTLVFGEEDDQLQHAVVRLLHGRGQTLATAECGTAGLMAEWLAGLEGSADVYRGGLVLAATAESAETLAARCREQFGADYGLAVGPLPSPTGTEAAGEGGQPPTVQLALSSAAGIRAARPLPHPPRAIARLTPPNKR